jgi:pSer/pThr/pTyr-binding forkhead associated (FHA) protein
MEEVEDLRALAKGMTQQQFVERFPHLFAVFREAEGGITPFSFHTEVAHPNAPPSTRGTLRVKPLVKSSSNPYADRVSIGRARNCDIILRDGSVSKLHAQLRTEPDGSMVVIDLDSQNGTSVNDARATPNQPLTVRADDVITVGTVGVRVLSAKVVHTILSKM